MLGWKGDRSKKKKKVREKIIAWANEIAGWDVRHLPLPHQPLRDLSALDVLAGEFCRQTGTHQRQLSNKNSDYTSRISFTQNILLPS